MSDNETRRMQISDYLQADIELSWVACGADVTEEEREKALSIRDALMEQLEISGQFPDEINEWINENQYKYQEVTLSKSTWRYIDQVTKWEDVNMRRLFAKNINGGNNPFLVDGNIADILDEVAKLFHTAEKAGMSYLIETVNSLSQGEQTAEDYDEVIEWTKVLRRHHLLGLASEGKQEEGLPAYWLNPEQIKTVRDFLFGQCQGQADARDLHAQDIFDEINGQIELWNEFALRDFPGLREGVFGSEQMQPLVLQEQDWEYLWAGVEP